MARGFNLVVALSRDRDLGEQRPLTAAVLKDADYAAWTRRHSGGDVPYELPYGLEALLSDGIRLVWSDADHHPPWTTGPLRRLRDTVEHRAGVRVLNPLLSLGKVARADVTLTLLEDSGLFLARRRRRRLWQRATSPLVILSCWLAEEARHFDPQTLAWHREALRGADAVLFWSSNQEQIFSELLGVPRRRLHFVPFGTDHRFFHPRHAGDDGYILSAGQDRGRDYRVLLEAAAGLRMPVKLVCKPENVGGMALPPNVELVGQVPHHVYRDLMARARAVVVPTDAPAYPSGQSVMLEAMALGKCCIVTASPAMRDYVEDSETALTVPPHDAAALRAAIDRAASDEGLRDQLGHMARRLVEERFNHEAMWRVIGSALRAAAS